MYYVYTLSKKHAFPSLYYSLFHGHDSVCCFMKETYATYVCYPLYVPYFKCVPISIVSIYVPVLCDIGVRVPVLALLCRSGQFARNRALDCASLPPCSSTDFFIATFCFIVWRRQRWIARRLESARQICGVF